VNLSDKPWIDSLSFSFKRSAKLFMTLSWQISELAYTHWVLSLLKATFVGWTLIFSINIFIYLSLYVLNLYLFRLLTWLLNPGKVVKFNCPLFMPSFNFKFKGLKLFFSSCLRGCFSLFWVSQKPHPPFLVYLRRFDPFMVDLQMVFSLCRTLSISFLNFWAPFKVINTGFKLVLLHKIVIVTPFSLSWESSLTPLWVSSRLEVAALISCLIYKSESYLLNLRSVLNLTLGLLPLRLKMFSWYPEVRGLLLSLNISRMLELLQLFLIGALRSR
jgi:hypothetical protein